MLVSAAQKVEATAARLRHPRETLALHSQTLTAQGRALDRAISQTTRTAEHNLQRVDAPRRLPSGIERLLHDGEQRLGHASALLDSYSYERVLDRGFVLVRGPDGPITNAAAAIPGLDITLQFQAGETRDSPALHYAVFHGHAAMAALLLEHGADVHALGYENNHEMTPAIVLAASEGGINVLRLLLEKGADPNAQSANGVRPLSTALRHEKHDRIQLLRNYGAVLENTIATADVRYDRPYFESVYREWLKHRSKYRQFEASIALVILFWGIALAVRYPQQWLVGALISCYGTYNFSTAITHKRRWVDARIASAGDDKSVDLWFDSETLTSVSANGISSMRLSGFLGFTPASDGFFLIPDTGVSIYVPRAAIEPCSSYPKLIELLSKTAGQVEMLVEED